MGAARAPPARRAIGSIGPSRGPEVTDSSRLRARQDNFYKLAIWNRLEIICDSEDAVCRLHDAPCQCPDPPCHSSNPLCHPQDALCHPPDALCHHPDAVCHPRDRVCQ